MSLDTVGGGLGDWGTGCSGTGQTEGLEPVRGGQAVAVMSSVRMFWPAKCLACVITPLSSMAAAIPRV